MSFKPIENDKLIVRFASWEFHVADEALYCVKEPGTPQLVPLENICRKSLAYFVQNPGRVISRDELLDKVWNVTNVTDVRISRAISILRSALGDDANNPKFILTIPKQGYKFIALNSSLEKAITPTPRRAKRLYLSLGVISFFVFLTISFFMVKADSAKTLKSFTMHEMIGNAMDYHLSPNAKMLAYISETEIDPMAVNKDLGGNLAIKNFTSSETVVLKKRPDTGSIVGPVWHPFERKIAYRIVNPSVSCEIRVVTLNDDYSGIIEESAPIPCAKEFTFLGKMAWSFDGQYLIYPDFSKVTENVGIYRINVVTGVKDQLTSPPSNSLGDYYISASPSRNELIFLRDDSKTLSQLWIIDLSTFEQTRVHTFDDTVYPHFVEWLPDESGFIYQGSKNEFVTINRKTKEKKRYGDFGSGVQSMQFCNTGKIFAASFTGQQYATGKSNNPFLSNELNFTIHTKNPYYFVNPVPGLPDAYFSAPEKTLELWIDHKDGHKRKVETFGATHFNAKSIFSPDGLQLLAVVGESVWLSNFDGVKKQLNQPGQIILNPSWAANKHEVFAIVPADNWRLIAIDLNTKAQRTVGTGYSFYQQSPDGKFEIYVKTNSDTVMVKDLRLSRSYRLEVPDFDRTKNIKAVFVNNHLYVKCSRCELPGFQSSQLLVRHNVQSKVNEFRTLDVFGDDRDFHVTSDEAELFFDVKEKHRRYSLNVLSPK